MVKEDGRRYRRWNGGLVTLQPYRQRDFKGRSAQATQNASRQTHLYDFSPVILHASLLILNIDTLLP